MPRIMLVLILLNFSVAQAQEVKPPRQESRPRFDLRAFEDLYPQDTPQKAMQTVLKLLDRDRYDYMLAHLIDPVFVDGQLAITYPKFEKQARNRVEDSSPTMEASAKESLIKKIATQENFQNLQDRLRTTLTDDPGSFKELQRLLKDGVVEESGEAVAVSSKDIKNRKLFLRKIGDRWFLENRNQ